MVAENLRAEIEANPLLEIVEGPLEVSFDGSGNLEEVLKGSAVGAD